MNLSNSDACDNHCWPGGSCDVSLYLMPTGKGVSSWGESPQATASIPKERFINSALDGRENQMRGKHGIYSWAEINAETSTLNMKWSWRCLMSTWILSYTGPGVQDCLEQPKEAI